jgi:uncharacterized protein (TIGR02453 family)
MHVVGPRTHAPSPVQRVARTARVQCPTMTKRFPGFPKDMITFFRGLARNNSREWFTAHKEVFEEKVHRPMIELAGLVNDALRRFAVDNVVANPAKALYRVYRDTRFSKDKTPYKTHIGVTYPRAGLPKHAGAGFYFSVAHDEVEVAGGVYMPEPEQVSAIRRAIAADGVGFSKVMEDRPLQKQMGPLLGEKLKRLPKDWDTQADAPAAEYLKFKQFYWYITLPAELALGPKILDVVVERFRAMRSGVAWFNNAILKARMVEEAKARPLRPDPMW